MNGRAWQDTVHRIAESDTTEVTEHAQDTFCSIEFSQEVKEDIF